MAEGSGRSMRTKKAKGDNLKGLAEALKGGGASRLDQLEVRAKGYILGALLSRRRGCDVMLPVFVHATVIVSCVSETRTDISVLYVRRRFV